MVSIYLKMVDICWYTRIWSGWWLTYLSEKYEFVSSIGMMTLPTEWENKSHVPVTTNQIWYMQSLEIWYDWDYWDLCDISVLSKYVHAHIAYIHVIISDLAYYVMYHIIVNYISYHILLCIYIYTYNHISSDLVKENWGAEFRFFCRRLGSCLHKIGLS